MKTDRELLELAASAVGINYNPTVKSNRGLYCASYEDQWRTFYWNSLTDDGDALRLRNKLRMDVFYTDQGVNVAYDDALLAFEPWGSDDCDTERLAITRAAAQMQLNREKNA